MLINLSRKSEVSNENIAIPIDQNVGRFNISMYYLRRVQKIERTQTVVGNYNQGIFCKVIWIRVETNHLLKVAINELCD